MRRRKLLWFTVGKPAWRVYVVDRIELDGAEVRGLTDYAKRTMQVAAWLPYRQLCEVTMHELLHSFYEEPGDEVMNAAEERLITGMQAKAFDRLTELGLRLPPFPVGWEEFRRRVIEQRKGAS